MRSGPFFLIQNLLKNFFPDDYTKFRIESNYGSCSGRKWKIDFHDDRYAPHQQLTVSDHGHDKGRTMQKIQQEYSATHGAKPFTVFCGDGVSDLSAARKADLLFVRWGRALEPYCLRQQIAFTGFDDFQVILESVTDLKQASV